MTRAFKTGLTSDGTITGSSIVKSGGTSSQFLKADGSVDSSTYLTSASTTYDAGNLSGTTLKSTVVTSSLTSVGTITSGTWNATVISPTYGGTGVNNGAKRIFIQSTTPSSPAAGDVWIWY